MEGGVREDVEPNLLLETLKMMNKKGLVSQPVKMGRCKFTKKKPFNIKMTKNKCVEKKLQFSNFLLSCSTIMCTWEMFLDLTLFVPYCPF